jgi:hypothetical protein
LCTVVVIGPFGLRKEGLTYLLHCGKSRPKTLKDEGFTAGAE